MQIADFFRVQHKKATHNSLASSRSAAERLDFGQVQATSCLYKNRFPLYSQQNSPDTA